MNKRLSAALLSACMATALLAPTASAWTSDEDALYSSLAVEISVTTEQLTYMEEIYSYLTDEMGLNTAAACGLLANMYRESRFDPAICSDSTTSIGLVQWYGSNRTAEVEWCNENNYDPWSLEGQLEYLRYQLEGSYQSIYNYLLSVENSAEGAYDAAWYFCYNFERPSDTESASDSRGILARDVFFPFYQELNAVSRSEALPFEDVDEEDWFYETVLYAYNEDMISGTSFTTFSPHDYMTRAQAVQILYNLNDNPTILSEAPFEDVSDDMWYSDAVDWAWYTGCVNGVSETSFDPEGLLTREQMVQILYNYYTVYLGYEVDEEDDELTDQLAVALANELSDATADTATEDLTDEAIVLGNFADSGEISFGADAFLWAVTSEIVTGEEIEGTYYLKPTEACTRAEGCTMLVRFVSTFL